MPYPTDDTGAMMAKMIVACWILGCLFYLRANLIRNAQPQPVGNWIPIGRINGRVLYERRYASGKKSWRYEHPSGCTYLHASAVKQALVTPLY